MTLRSLTFSLIERGKNSPTVSSLHALAGALGVGIVEFFQDSEIHDSVFTEKAHRLSLNREGVLMESLGVGLQNQQLEPFLYTLDPGIGTTTPLAHAGQEFIHCLKGEVEYVVEDKTYRLKPGDSLLFEATRPHSVRNPGSRKTVFISVLQAIGFSSTVTPQHF
jgi:quercetin dioxygenase-like cupin family protein